MEYPRGTTALALLSILHGGGHGLVLAATDVVAVDALLNVLDSSISIFFNDVVAVMIFVVVICNMMRSKLKIMRQCRLQSFAVDSGHEHDRKIRHMAVS